MHHSLSEAHTVKLNGCDCTFLACEKKKQNAIHWAVGFCWLLQNQVVSLSFYAFRLAFWASLRLYILG